MTLAVASAPVNDPKEIRSAQISEGWQRYCVEATSEVYVVPSGTKPLDVPGPSGSTRNWKNELD